MKLLWRILFFPIRKYYTTLSPEKVFDKVTHNMQGYLKRHGLYSLEKCLKMRFPSTTYEGSTLVITLRKNKQLRILTVDDDTSPTGVKSICLVETSPSKKKLIKVIENPRWLR